jgi:hypothetical protein
MHSSLIRNSLSVAHLIIQGLTILYKTREVNSSNSILMFKVTREDHSLLGCDDL